MTAPPPRRDLLPALTPLRFPAAFAAVLFHVWGLFLGPGGAIPPLRTWHLWAGVSFFFVLSGFILTYNYLDEFRRPTRRGVWNFLVARWARTYPMHVLGLLIMLPLDWGKLVRGEFGNPLVCLSAHLGLWHAWWPMTMNKAMSFNSPSWSLSAEWFLYLTLPILIPLLTSGPKWRRGLVIAVALTPWALAVAGLFGSTLLGPTTPYRYPPVRLVDFLAGVLLAMAWCSRHGAGTVQAPQSVAKATRTELAAVLFLVAWTAVVVWRFKSVKWLSASGWLGVYVPPFLVLIWALARGAGLLSKMLASRVPTYLGDISFAFYMLHLPVLAYFHIEGHRFGFPGWAWYAKWGAVMGLSLALAAASYHLYEIPLRDRLRRWLSIKRPKPAEVPAPQEVRRAA